MASGWYSLLSTHRQNELMAQEDSTPVACPNDGEPLENGPDGFLYCKFDGWRPWGAPSIAGTIMRGRR
jgi:hypothetical protein